MSTPQSYRDVLADNAAAQRARMRMRQESLAARMRNLGFKTWRKQTVSELEAKRRTVQGDEVLGLALALETTVPALMALPFDAAAVMLPSGELIARTRVADNDGTVQWEGDHPKLAPLVGVTPPLDAQLAAKREELRRLEEFIGNVRRQAEPHDGDHGV